VEYVKRFPDRIKHVHWKDLGEDWLGKRGKIYGCGMGTAALGEGVVNVREVMHELMKAGFDGDTTLEIAGADAVKRSVQQLQQWMASTSSAVVA
jgi:inosose dehydratase